MISKSPGSYNPKTGWREGVTVSTSVRWRPAGATRGLCASVLAVKTDRIPGRGGQVTTSKIWTAETIHMVAKKF